MKLFVEAWVSKMDLILSQESRRINLLAIYTMLPKLDGEIISLTFAEIGKLTFSILDSY